MDVARYDHADGRIYRCWQIGAPKGCYEWTWPGATMQMAESIAAGRLGRPRDVMNGRGLVQPCRLQNLLLFGGARGDVMNWHWCDQAEIMESIAV